MSSVFSAERPHPYGVKPPGNAYLASSSARQLRCNGLGQDLNRLSDEVLIDLLSFCDAASLVTLARASRALYVYAHNSDLWRDLTLTRFLNGIKFVATWKDTYASMVDSNTALHVPLEVEGIYSHYLYRPWLCRFSDLDEACPGFSRHNDIARIHTNDLSVDKFVSQYEKVNTPVIIAGLVEDWEALTKWTPEYLSQVCGNRLFRATSATAPIAAHFTMNEYWSYARATAEEAPLYLFERDFTSVNGLAGDYNVPSFFSNHATHGSDLFNLLGSRRPDHRWMVIGPKRSGSIFHIDPNETNAWNVLIQGYKKWIFYPPHVNPPGVSRSEDGADVTVPLSTGEWLLTFWKYHLDARKDPDLNRRPLECIVGPGEAIFVPHGYWHMVVNLEDTIALTHNYVSSSNLGDVLYFLKHKRDQVSGVRDRRNEAAQPETLYEEFTRELRKVHPELLYVGMSVLQEKEKEMEIQRSKDLDDELRRKRETLKINKRKRKATWSSSGSGEERESGSIITHSTESYNCKPMELKLN
jgi:hypothetical protein